MLQTFKEKLKTLKKAFVTEDPGLHPTAARPLRMYKKGGEWTDFSTDTLVGKDMNKFRNWKCGAGIRNLCIGMEGQVYSATCHIGGMYGNVFTEFTIPDDWVTCTFERCTCGADLFIPKFKDSEKDLRKTFKLHAKGQGQPNLELSEAMAMERTHFSSYKQIYWEIGKRCNFACSYCGPGHHNKTDQNKSLESLVKATDQLFEKFAKGELVNFVISGGEPTINPAFMDWVKYIHSKGHHVSVNSNGSRNESYYQELIRFTDLNLSLHFEFWNEEKFKRNIVAILDEKKKRNNIDVGHFEIKIMMPPSRYEEALKMDSWLMKLEGFKEFCAWSVVPIRVGKFLETVMDSYEPEHRLLFGDRGNQLSL